MTNDVTPAFVMFPLALLSATALLLDCFRADPAGLAIGVSGVSGAPSLWIAFAAAVVLAGSAVRIVVRSRRGRRVAPPEVWIMIGVAAVGFLVSAVVLLGWSTGHLVAEGVTDPPSITLVPDRLLYLATGALAAIAASACGWLSHILDPRA